MSKNCPLSLCEVSKKWVLFTFYRLLLDLPGRKSIDNQFSYSNSSTSTITSLRRRNGSENGEL